MSQLSIDPAKCQGHGRCALIAPDHFDIDDTGYGVVLGGGVDDGDQTDIDEAVLSCPEHAIAVE